MAVLSLLQLILTPLVCAILAYNAVAWQWRSSLLSAWQAANAWGDATCAQYQSHSVDACGYKASVLGFLSATSFTDWPADEKPNELRVAVATLLVSFWVTRTFRDVYAAAVDTAASARRTRTSPSPTVPEGLHGGDRPARQLQEPDLRLRD